MSEDTYDLKPSKDAYQAVKSDVTPVSAFKELIDNALDNWRRVLDGLDPVEIEIEYHDGGPEGDDEIIIRDNTGGVEEEDLHILFALGQSNKEEIEGSIGAYGVGAKKAIVNLGNSATIVSRHLYADTGWGFSIDEDWLTDESDWTVDKVEYDDIDKGVTEIRISDLNTPWSKYRDNLKEDLRQTYQYFLRTDRMEDMENVSIIIREFDDEGNVEDATELDPPEPVDWSFTPMDGLFARRYEDIDLNALGFDASVDLNITVGLMREASAEESGADIFCQNRQVLSGVQDERAGFGAGSGSASLGKFSGQHRRLRVIIEYETEGDATVLPWDAQKSDIDPYNRVSRAAFDWIRRIVRPYYLAAGAYDEIPTTLTRPYDRDCEHSVTEHLDSPYDYSGRERVTHKPNKDFTDAKLITDRADVTAPLRLYSLNGLPEEFEPAYREEFLRLINDLYDIKLEDGEELPTDTIPSADVPEDLTEIEAEAVYDSLKQAASDHTGREPPERGVGFDDWEQTLYDLLFREALDERDIETDLSEFETFEIEPVYGSLKQAANDHAGRDPPERKIGLNNWQQTLYDVLLREALDEREIEANLSELATFETEPEPASVEETDETEDSPDGFDTAEPSAEEDDTGGAEESEGEGDSIEVETGADDEETGQNSLSGFSDESDDDASDEEEGHGGIEADPDMGIDIGGSSENYTLDLDEEEWETLVEALGLDEDASTEEVRDELFDTIETVRALRS